MSDNPCSLFPDFRPMALVASHMRSGTHFLMNALASCYGYVSSPIINFDPTSMGLNYYDPTDLSNYLLTAASRPIANVVKSHHMADFFRGVLPRLSKRYAIFYICRDPVDVLLSNWRFMYRWPWIGPQASDPLKYAQAEPSGAMLRVQWRQYPDMMRRWAGHVEGWRAAAVATSVVTFLRYEDLHQNFDKMMRSFEPVLGRAPHALVRPPRDVNIVPGGPEDPSGSGVPPDRKALRQLCRETIGDTMDMLGY